MFVGEIVLDQKAYIRSTQFSQGIEKAIDSDVYFETGSRRDEFSRNN